MKFVIILFLLLLGFFPQRALAAYEDSVEKIHYTHPYQLADGKPFDAEKKIGSRTPSITFFIWADLSEKYTQSFFQDTFPKLLAAYGSSTQFVYSHKASPLSDTAIPTAAIAECVARQGKFWENIDPITRNSEDVETLSYLKDVDTDKVRTCIHDASVKNIITESDEDGKYFGFNAVPTFIIQNAKNPRGYNIKVTGAQSLDIFERAFLEAKEGDLSKAELTDLKNRVHVLEEKTNDTSKVVQHVSEKQSVLENELSIIKQTILKLLKILNINLSL